MHNATAQTLSHDAYCHPIPSQSAYYRCVQDHFEKLEATWPDCYEQRYGFWRPCVLNVIYRYLDCRELHFSFGRVRCDQRGHEYLLAFSCKRSHFCPSCHQKRVVAFSECPVGQVLKKVSHRQWVFAIPKRLRIYFIFDRTLLAKLSRYAWKVLKMLKAEGKITDAVIENMVGWRHSGFNVYCGPTIWPDTPEAIEDLSRYILRTCFSKERMIYIPATDTADELAKVIYSSKDRRESQTFNALDWLAQLVTHIPHKGGQMVRYYGYYSNNARGMRQKADCDDDTPALVESPLSSTAWRKNGARLIQKIYEVAPLLCPNCHVAMRIIAFVDD